MLRSHPPSFLVYSLASISHFDWQLASHHSSAFVDFPSLMRLPLIVHKPLEERKCDDDSFFTLAAAQQSSTLVMFDMDKQRKSKKKKRMMEKLFSLFKYLNSLEIRKIAEEWNNDERDDEMDARARDENRKIEDYFCLEWGSRIESSLDGLVVAKDDVNFEEEKRRKADKFSTTDGVDRECRLKVHHILWYFEALHVFSTESKSLKG